MNRIKLFALGAAMALPAAGVMFASAAPNNLIANGTFDNDVAGWDNFGGNPTLYKHSMQITNTYAGAGGSYYSGWYCVKVKAGTEYVTEADYWVPESAPENSGASLQLHYYASNDCSGGNMTSGGEYREGGKLPAQRGDWEHFKFKEVAPDGAKSVRVRASAIKEPQGGGSIPGAHVVYFDNVSFVEQLKLALPTAVATPKGPDILVANPDPTQPPKGPDDVVSNPEPTQPPVNPDDLDAEPDPTQPPSQPGDVTSNPEPSATPAAPNTGDSNPNGGSHVDVIPQGQNSQQSNTGNSAGSDIHPAAQDEAGSVGLGLGLLFIGAGGVCAALGLGLAAVAKRRGKQAAE
jgi:hypothetical protein